MPFGTLAICGVTHGVISSVICSYIPPSTHIVAMDLFVVPSVTFERLYVFIIVRLTRGDLVWINVTLHPAAEWNTHQITEAFSLE